VKYVNRWCFGKRNDHYDAKKTWNHFEHEEAAQDPVPRAFQASNAVDEMKDLVGWRVAKRIDLRPGIGIGADEVAQFLRRFRDVFSNWKSLTRSVFSTSRFGQAINGWVVTLILYKDGDFGKKVRPVTDAMPQWQAKGATYATVGYSFLPDLVAFCCQGN
jgi:hypothetical protein